MDVGSLAPTKCESAPPVRRPRAIVVANDGLRFAIAERDLLALSLAERLKASAQAIEGAVRYINNILAYQCSYGSNGMIPDPTTYACAAVTVGDAMRERGIDVDRHRRDGTLPIWAAKKDLYIKPGYFDPDWTIRPLSQHDYEAKAAGFSGIRIIGEMAWFLGDDADSGRLIEFELKVNRLFPQIEASGICQYNLNRFSAEVILGVVQTHPLVIYRGDVCRNPYYIPPDEFLKPNRAAVELDRLLSNIHDYRQAEQEIRASEQRWRSIFENSAIGIAMAELDGRFVVTNRAYQELVGYAAAELQDMKLPDLTHEDDRGSITNLITELRAGQRKEFQIEERCLSKDRPLFPLEPDLVSLVFVTPDGERQEVWLNNRLGLIFGLKEWYDANLPWTGGTFTLEPTQQPDEFQLVATGETDPALDIPMDRLQALLQLEQVGRVGEVGEATRAVLHLGRLQHHEGRRGQGRGPDRHEQRGHRPPSHRLPQPLLGKLEISQTN